MAFRGQVNYGSWRPALSLLTLVDELNVWDPQWQCLGLIGDQTHQDQAAYSDHNPVVKDPRTGEGIVRAIDIRCSTQAKMNQLRDHLNAMYGRHDPRLWYYGYIHLDGLVTDWGGNGSTHPDPGDDGHVHLSLTQTTYPSVPGGYVAAIDSTAPWGLLGTEGSGTPITGDAIGAAIHESPAASTTEDDDMPKLYRATSDFADIKKDEVYVSCAGLTVHKIGSDGGGKDATNRLILFTNLYGKPSDLAGADVLRLRQEASNAQAMLAAGTLG